MRTTPIPDAEVWPGAMRHVIGPSDLTSEDLAPVEIVSYPCAFAGRVMPVHSVRCVLDPGDLEQLAAGGTIWLSFIGGMVPFDVNVRPPSRAGG